jgi:tetratricopeptide (TPR) repeat protein
MDTPPYNIAVVRNLIRDAFTDDDLRRFCQDRPLFRFILSYFSSRFSFEDMIETVIEQCQTRALLPDLLTAVREHNPRQYHRYSDQLELVGGGQKVVNLLPLDMTHTFKDRQREIQALRDYLTGERVRLVSIVGRGGWGKTALACHVLADLQKDMLLDLGEAEERPIDGILYLGARTTGLGLERIYADVSRMLDKPAADKLATRWTHGDTSLTVRVGYLLETMQDGLYLILLDNLEDHLTEEGEITDEGLSLFVERCLLQPSGARLITTSRQQIRLPAAALPRVRNIPMDKGLPEDDASALLHELDPQGKLGLRDAPQEDVQHTIRLTQGIPRALELVAGILDHDPTIDLPQLLADERLVGKEIVEQLVAEGYSRLKDEDRRVMEALAVFDRPVEEKAIAYLLQPWFPNLDVRHNLRRLVGSYFVSANRSSGECSLHPLDREYAYRQLPDGDEADAYNQRNLELRTADFYASICAPESEWATIEDLAPQLAEFEHRIRGQDYDQACRTLDSIEYHYLFKWGYYTELVRMRLELVERIKDRSLRAHNLASLGHNFRFLGQVQTAIEMQRHALDAARELGDQWLEGFALGELGNAHAGLGQPDLAIAYLNDALTTARETNNRNHEGAWLGNLGFVYHDLGQVEEATSCFEQALAIAQETRNRRAEATWLGSLGFVYLDVGQIAQAVLCHEKALTIAQEIHDRRWEGVQLGGLASAYRAQGQVEHAVELHEKDLAIAREIHDRGSEGVCLDKLGLIYFGQRQNTEAVYFHTQALTIFRTIYDRRGESYALIRDKTGESSAGHKGFEYSQRILY